MNTRERGTECATCGGSGIDRSDAEQPDECPTCGGKGVTPKAPMTDDRDCPSCHGVGGLNVAVECDTPGGPAEDSRYEPCPACEGRGRVPSQIVTLMARAAWEDRWGDDPHSTPYRKHLYESEYVATARLHAAALEAAGYTVARLRQLDPEVWGDSLFTYAAPAVEEAEPRVFPNGDYYAAPAGTECPTCGGTGVTPKAEHLGFANPPPCPTCSPNETSER